MDPEKFGKRILLAILLLMEVRMLNVQASEKMAFPYVLGAANMEKKNSPATSRTVISRHSGMNVLTLAPDGKQAAVGFNGLELTVWDLKTHQLVRTLRVPKAGGDRGGLAYSPDGKYLAAGLSVVGIWNAQSGAMVREISGPFISRDRPQPRGIRSLTFSPDSAVLVAAYVGGSAVGERPTTGIVAYRVETGETIYSFELEQILGTDLLFTPDGKFLVGGLSQIGFDKATGVRDYNSFLYIWNAANGQLEKSISRIHALAPESLAVSSDGKFVATGTSTLRKVSDRNPVTNEWVTILNEDPIKIWDWRSGKLVNELKGLQGAARAMTFSSNGRYLFSSQSQKSDEHIWIWDLSTGNVVDRIRTSGQSGAPTGIALTFDGSKLVVADGSELVVVEINH